MRRRVGEVRLDAGDFACHGAVMAMRLLFGALALGLVAIAVAAWRGGQPIPAVGALVIGLWLATLAVRRR